MKQDLRELQREIEEEMLAEARKRYSEVVIDHSLHPRNMGPMDRPDGFARLTGPCGDTMEISIRVRGGRIAQANFMTDGCATSVASGSMATVMAVGRRLNQAASVSQADILEALGGLPEDSEHCALLASETLRRAVANHLEMKRDPWKKMYGH